MAFRLYYNYFLTIIIKLIYLNDTYLKCTSKMLYANYFVNEN